MATSLLPRPVGGAAAALSTQASPSRVFVSLPLPSTDPLLSVSSALPHLSRSGPSFQKIQRGLWLAQGPGKPRDLRLFLSATLHLLKWSPSPFPKASRASEVSSEDHLVETGDSLIRQIQAGSISHSLGGQSRSRETHKPRTWGARKSRGRSGGRARRGEAGKSTDRSKLCLLPPSPIPLPHPCWQGKWPRWPGQERCQRERWQRWEKGLVDCKLSIMAQIISILRRALCTMPRKSNTLKG